MEEAKPKARPELDEKLQLKWKKLFDKFMSDPNTSEWLSPPGLSAPDRKMLHTLAENAGILSLSKGEGKNRLVVIRKEKRPPNEPSFINTTVQKKFRDDFDIKINLCEPQDFMYFIELYDKHYQTKQKLEWILEATKQLGGSEAIANYYDEIKEKLVTAISTTPAFQRFKDDSFKKFDVDFAGLQDPISAIKLSPGNAYEASNDGKFFVSLDLKSANFNSMKYYDNSLVHNCSNWEELIGQFTQYPCLVKNKAFRQKVFWQLEPGKQRKISEWMITRVLRVLVSQGLVPPQSVVYLNLDELIFQVPPNQLVDITKKCQKVIQSSNDLADISHIVQIESFRICQISTSRDYFLKEVFVEILSKEDWIKSPKVVFKSIPPEHFVIFYKSYYGLEMEERDLRIAYDFKKKTYKLVNTDMLGIKPVHPVQIQ